MREQAIQSVICYLNKAIEKYRELEFKDVRIAFDLEGTDAGQMVYDGQYHLRFNEEMMNHNPIDFIENTIPHEVAHLVVAKQWGRHTDPHGTKWHSVMKMFNVDALERHRHMYSYACGCRVHNLPADIHEAIQKGIRELECQICGRGIQLMKPGMAS